MNFNSVMETFFDYSEKFLTFFINAIYMLLVAFPLVLVAGMIKESIYKIPILFIPLVSLYGIGVKSLTYAFYMIYIKKNAYYKPFFWKSFSENFLNTALYYLIVSTLLYFGLSSTLILISEVSGMFWILFTVIALVLLSNIIYSTIQFALYDEKSLRVIINNSLLLSLAYGVLTVGLSIALLALMYYFSSRTLFVVGLGLPAFALILVFVQRVMYKMGN